MNNLKIIFVNWTKPFFYKDQFTGYRKSSDSGSISNEYSIPDHEIVMQIAAITSAKKYGRCKVKLFTDDCGYEYYKKIGLLPLFDEIDVDVLNKDLVHTHWEICRGPLYINFDQLKEYGIEMPEFEEKMMIPNTSFLFVNDQKILDKYLQLHIQLVNNQYDKVPDWLWLMSDQHILGYTMRELNSDVAEITNKTFMQYPDAFHNRNKPGYIPDWIEMEGVIKNEPKLPYEHVWITKGSLINDREARNKRISEWNAIITDNGFGEYVKKKLI